MAIINRVFIRLSSNYFFYFALLGLISPFLALYLDGKGFNSRQVGEILAIITATKIVAPSLWAILADKTGKPLLIIRLGALLALLSFSVLFWLNDYWPITFSLALFTLFWTAILPQLEVHTLTSVRHSNKIYARIRLWGSLGFIALAVIAGEVMEAFGYQTFTHIGVIILLGLLATTMMLTPSGKARLTKNKTEQEAILPRLLDGRFISFFIAGLLLQVSFAPYYGFFALFLRDLHYSGLAIGLFISLGVVAEVVAFIYMGTLFKRFSLSSLLVFSLAITGLRWLLIPEVADSVLWLCLIQLSHAASFAIYHSASMQFISSHFTKTQQSRGQGMYLGGVYGIGGAIGAYVTGILWLDGLGASDTFMMAGLSALLGAIIMIFSKK
ncbi:MFS transporter [Colwellia piezophila]|uniref:MFS transporter n=1 Tax=Colwellia piezophila TaxID=211668 RepID=UPI00036C15F1|nr:MFS transporter [Colwellia piezophila]